MSTPPAPQDAYIRDLPLLARLPEADLQALASSGRVRRFPAGTAIFHEGDPGDSLHVVVEGQVRITVLSGSGSEATVAMVDTGDCFGELALLDGKPRSATATAVTATRTFVVTRNDFVAWLKDRPGAALALLETLSLRLRRTDEALADLTFLDLPHRLAKQLLRLSAVDVKGQRPAIKVTQAELASMLGVSRESVNKQLNAFARGGLVQISRGTVKVKDPEALRALPL
ncbi:MAG: Crp/Fnr family transcriptional regulator [Anaerolinea sp.]|nr:Crp/Fnr family transcriptional regulator [Anaerolinea sp.]